MFENYVVVMTLAAWTGALLCRRSDKIIRYLSVAGGTTCGKAIQTQTGRGMALT